MDIIKSRDPFVGNTPLNMRSFFSNNLCIDGTFQIGLSFTSISGKAENTEKHSYT
jgi:hypothetical protein